MSVVLNDHHWQNRGRHAVGLVGCLVCTVICIRCQRLIALVVWLFRLCHAFRVQCFVGQRTPWSQSNRPHCLYRVHVPTVGRLGMCLQREPSGVYDPGTRWHPWFVYWLFLRP